MDWIKILIEDILRLYKEKGRPLKLKEIEEDTKLETDDLSEGLKELRKRKLAELRGDTLYLTPEGEAIAQSIYDYHKAMEALFPHEIAHSMEHLSEGERERAKSLSRDSKPIDEIDGEGIISSIEIENPKLLARVIGIGLTPGSKFKVIKVRDDVVIVNLGGRLVAIDRSLSRRVRGQKQP